MLDINFNDIKNGSSDLPDIASETLPSEMMIRCKVAGDYYAHFFNAVLICKSEKDLVCEDEDIIISEIGSDSYPWLKIENEEDIQSLIVSTLKLNLNELKEFLQKIDLYISNDDLMDFECCSLEFHLGDKSFRYLVESEEKTGGIFFGTLARVTGGWKFYPRMREMNLEHSGLEDIKSGYKWIYSQIFK